MVKHHDEHPRTLGDYVKQERRKRGLSQRKLALAVGIHHSRIAKLENGELGNRLSPEFVQGLANALGIDVTKLLKYLGVTPQPELPPVRTYFRRKLGVDADEAEVLANLIEQHRKRKEPN